MMVRYLHKFLWKVVKSAAFQPELFRNSGKSDTVNNTEIFSMPENWKITFSTTLIC